MRAWTVLAIAIVLSMTALAKARLTRGWTYQEMFDDADLVVLGQFVSTRDTDERNTVLDVAVVGVLSEFETRLVLKGPKDVAAFRLHHYRLASDDDLMIVNGPNLLRFPEKYKPCYMMFLRKEREDVYAPVTGQTDPAMESVLELPVGG